MDHIARSVQGITEYFKWTICVCLYPSPSWLSLRILFPQVNSASRIHFSGWPSFGCASCQDKRIDIEMASKRSSFLTIVLPCTRPPKLQQAHRVVACQRYSSIAILTQQPTLYLFWQRESCLWCWRHFSRNGSHHYQWFPLVEVYVDGTTCLRIDMTWLFPDVSCCEYEERQGQSLSIMIMPWKHQMYVETHKINSYL